MSNKTAASPAVQEFSPEDIKRLTEIVDEGVQTMQEIEDMKGALSDALKTIAEELQIKPAQLSKVVKICFKNSLNDEKANFDELVEIIEAVGRA